MWFEMVKVRRAGVLVPRWQLAALPRYQGYLRVQEQRVIDLERPSIVAEIIEPEVHLDQRQYLYDARLLSTTSQWMSMTGFEVDHTTGGTPVHYMQTWLLTPKPEPARE